MRTAIRLSTDMVAPGQRADLMGDVMARQLCGGEIGVEDANTVHCDWTLSALDAGVVLCRADQSGFRATRAGRMLRDDDADFSIFIGRRGIAPFEQNDRRQLIHPGQMLFVAHSRAVESGWMHCDVSIVRLPREVLPHDLSIERAGGALLDRDVPSARLLRAYLDALEPLAGTGRAPAFAARHLADLAIDALREMGGAEVGASRGEGARAARLAMLREAIERRHADPGFNMAAAAAAIGLSERAGYLLLESAGESFSDLLYRIRLDRAAERLRAGYAGRMIDLALDVGFSDISHFNRRFRQRFALSPSEMRASRMG